MCSRHYLSKHFFSTLLEIIKESKKIIVKSNTSKNNFLRMVKKAKNYIKIGDIFQVVLSQRFETKLTKKPFGVNLTFLPVIEAPDYPGYIKYTAQAYRMMINEIVYALTH